MYLETWIIVTSHAKIWQEYFSNGDDEEEEDDEDEEREREEEKEEDYPLFLFQDTSLSMI